MASYKDVALLNSSLDQLADSLLKERMMEQQRDLQTQQIGARRDVGLAQAAVRQQNATERARHNQAMEGTAVDKNETEQSKLEDQRKKNAQQMWGDTVKMYGSWVDKGIMDPNQAQTILQSSYDKMPDQAKSYIADHPSVQAILSGQNIFQSAPDKQKDIQPKVSQVTLPDGRKVNAIYNPQTGAFHLDQGEKTPAGPKVSVDIDASGNPTKRTITGTAADVGAELQGGYLMRDPQGNTVRVPATRKAEMLKKGYTLQSAAQ